MATHLPNKPKIPLSIILQGQLTNSTSRVFLFPDGSGSGLAYGKLPLIHPDICLIAMNSPFLSDPRLYTCSIEECTGLWFKELRRVQSKGPYTLGGWSAGGYYAFEMARLLLKAGEEIEDLVLIDSPCRLFYGALPMKTVRSLAERALMGNWDAESPPEWMLNHFESTIAAVEKYKPMPISTKGISRVYLVWAKDGVETGTTADSLGIDFQVKINQLLLRARTDFTALGWETLLPEAVILTGSMDGNHFQLVYPPFCHRLATLLRSVWKGRIEKANQT